jgi:hypothetical protein
VSKDAINTGKKHTITVIRPKLVGLTVVANASQEGVSGAKNWTTVVSDRDDVIVEAKTNPNTENTWLQISWSGDIAGAVVGKPNRRRISHSASAKRRVEAELGGVKDYVDVWVISLEVVELGFQKNYDLCKWPAGTLIAGPVWKKSANPDLPVCYRKASNEPELTPKVQITPNLLITVQTALKAVSANPKIEFFKKGVSLTGSDAQIPGMSIKTGALDDKVAVAQLKLEWSFSIDGEKTWTKINATGPHKIYQVYDAPKENPLYDRALEKACAYVGGGADVAGRINEGIPRDLKYDPSNYQAGHPLSYYDAGVCLCMNNAMLLRYLCRSAGIDGSVIYVWGGIRAGEVLFYSGTSPGVYGSFMVLAPKKDFASANPHFTYHAQTVVNGTTYDPSYGTTGLANPVETDPSASTQTGNAWPPPDVEERSPASAGGWSCPH